MKPDALYSSLLLGTPAATKHCCLQAAVFRYRFSTGTALQRNPPPRLKESLGYYVHIYIPLPHRCGCLHRCKWEGYSPTSQTALQVPLRILFGVTILEIVRTQSARFLPSCFGIGGGGGIRTLAPLSGPTRFPSEPLHHLGTPPWGDRWNLNP